MRAFLLGTSCCALCVTPASAEKLTLRCDGIGTFPQMQGETVSVTGDVNLSASNEHVGAGAVRDRMLVEINDEMIRVRLPRAIVPPINSGGADGWWTLSDPKVTEAEITGKLRLNPFNKPVVRIDRQTGDIEVQGSFKMSFRGTCDVANPAARKF